MEIKSLDDIHNNADRVPMDGMVAPSPEDLFIIKEEALNADNKVDEEDIRGIAKLERSQIEWRLRS